MTYEKGQRVFRTLIHDGEVSIGAGTIRAAGEWKTRVKSDASQYQDDYSTALVDRYWHPSPEEAIAASRAAIADEVDRYRDRLADAEERLALLTPEVTEAAIRAAYEKEKT